MYQSYLAFYTTLLKVAHPEGIRRRHQPWIALNYQRLLTKWLTVWTKRYAKIHLQVARPVDILLPTHLQFQSFYDISRGYVAKQVLDIKAKLHGTMLRN